MENWVPILVLPNLDMRGTVECRYAAIVGLSDARIETLRTIHPKFGEFLSRFRSQFGDEVWPSTILLKADAPTSYFTAEAVSGFRDILAVSVCPYSRAHRLRFNRASYLAFSDIFEFYPWMVDKPYENLILQNAAQTHVHDVDVFAGQSFPLVPQTSVLEGSLDIPLARAAMQSWETRFSNIEAPWMDRKLFRSFNMANEALKVPAATATTFYDVGRSLALWVSAFEIIAHPGGKKQSNRKTVCALIERVSWRENALTNGIHAPTWFPNRSECKPLAFWMLEKIYEVRNDFLHGNDVMPSSLRVNHNVLIDYAACLYRLILTTFLELAQAEDVRSNLDTERLSEYSLRRYQYYKYQDAYEKALLTAL